MSGDKAPLTFPAHMRSPNICLPILTAPGRVRVPVTNLHRTQWSV